MVLFSLFVLHIVFGLQNARDAFSCKSLWRGLQQDKITALAWHPTQEGILAFGTQDGGNVKVPEM
jgi:hypothetical protein